MLDAKLIQSALDEIQKSYANGMVTQFDKLHQMIDLIDAHVNLYKKERNLDDITNQYDKAEGLLRQMNRVDRFLLKLNLYV
jgi:hypothetical protein